MQHSIDFLVDIFSPQFLNLRVSFLQLLQPEPHATNAGILGAFAGQFQAEHVP